MAGMPGHTEATDNAVSGLTRTLSPLGVWGLSFGCIIGYGAFSMPGSTFLPIAGPVGTAIALTVGAILILVVAVNYQFLCNRYPDSGGSYAFARNLFGYDHAFLCAWALVLAYVSLIGANATAFVHIGRYIFGSALQVGLHYQVAGYDIYLGEVAVTIAVLVLFAFLACSRKRILNGVNTLLAFVLLIGAIVCFAAVLIIGDGGLTNFDPWFSPATQPILGVLGIVALVPWAFMGFESVSHTAGECTFPARKMGPLMALAIIAGLAVYLMMEAMAVIGTPEGYGGWVGYIADLGNLDGTAALPTLNAAASALGGTGVILLGVVMFAALSTSMLGFLRAASRLLFCMAQDGILPERLAQLNKNHVPWRAVLLVLAICIFVPFVGRAAIGWATDATAISAGVAYGYTSMCAYRISRKEGRGAMKAASIAGIVISAVFIAFPLVPNFYSVGGLPAESYLILALWSLLGLFYFRSVFKRDESGRLGKTPLVWFFMLSLILFASTMWVRQATFDAAQDTVENLSAYYAQEYEAAGIELDHASEQREEARLQQEADRVEGVLMNDSLALMATLALSLIVLYGIFSLMLKRERVQEARRLAAEGANKAKTTFLSSMSHDIRTPMNAIIGYTELARREGLTLEETRAYLDKIDTSSKHLLGLLNDVLEMSRIESGKLEIVPVETDLRKLIDDVRDMYATQMKAKGITFVAEVRDVRDYVVMCDSLRFDRVLLNLVSNALKFTQEGGSVEVLLTQVEDPVNGYASYKLRVKDTGIGMTEEFAAYVFDAFERERTTTVSGIQGTGLGMSITKAIVDAMGGTIGVESAPNKGTEFVVSVSFEVVTKPASATGPAEGSGGETPEMRDFSGCRILVAEDNEINREIATIILEDAGFEVECVENGAIALEKIEHADAGHYNAVLMDVRMPVMDGREATRRIRALDDPIRANVPIIAAAANAFADDVKANLDAGMNAFVAKPIDVETLMQTLSEYV